MKKTFTGWLRAMKPVALDYRGKKCCNCEVVCDNPFSLIKIRNEAFDTQFYPLCSERCEKKLIASLS